MPLRRAFFWTHLALGITAGSIILIMCVTGVALTYEKQMLARNERPGLSYTAPPAGTPLAPVEALLAATPKATAFTVYADRERPAEIALGREGVLYVDPYKAESVGKAEVSAGLRPFFRLMNNWHRWLGGESAAAGGKSISDAANLIFFVIVLSGSIIWMPRQFSWRHLRPIVWFRGGLRGKAREWNWHNAIGAWSLIPLVLIVGSGVIMSYPWASNLLYRAAGSPLPPRNPPPAPGKPAWQGIDKALAVAMAQDANWQTIRVQAAAAGPYAFTIDEGGPGQPQYRGTLLVDRATAEVRTWTPFAANSLGQRLRLLARFTHTGEVLGATGQTIAGLATLGGAFLVYTGFSLALRRFIAWLRRSRRVAEPLRERELETASR